MKIQISTLFHASVIAGIMLTAAGCSSLSDQKGGILSDRGCIPQPYDAPKQAAAPTVVQNDIPTATPTFPTITTEKEPPLPSGTEAAAPATDDGPTFVSAKDGSVVQPKETKADGTKPADKKGTAPKKVRKYKVVSGDNLSTIAYRYRISWKDLAKENNLTEKSRLMVGQELILPENAAETPRNKPKAKKSATSSDSKKTGAAAARAEGEPIPADGFHTVQKGDSLWKIAFKYKVHSNDIRSLNPEINFDNLQIGSRIKLPKKSAKQADKKPAATETQNEPAAAVAPEVQTEAPQTTVQAIQLPTTPQTEQRNLAPEIQTQDGAPAKEAEAPQLPTSL